ncbi:MAG: YfhO family protein [Chloroflexota bacterium]
MTEHQPASDRAPAATRSTAVSLAALAALAGVALANRFVFDRWLARFDLYSFFIPWYGHLGARLRAFDLPGWNPHLFSGTPFAADPESGWMYLPAMLAFSNFDVLAGFEALAAIHVALAALGAWLLARALGLGPGPALVAGLACVLAPVLHWNTYCCLVLNQFAVWIPWALLGLELGLRAPGWRARIAPWSLAALAISQQFAGLVGQGWLLAPLLAAAWTGYRTLVDPARPGDPAAARLAAGLGAGIVAVGGGAALGAAGILPRIEFNAQSNVPFGDYAAHGAAGILNPPWTVPHLLAQLMGDAYDRRTAAIGGATLVLAMLAPALARRRHAAPFFAGLGLLTMLMTLPTTPVHRLLYVIPGLQSFHDHDAWRIWVLAPICFAMLAAIAAGEIPRHRGGAGLAALAVVPLLLMGLAARLIAPEEGFIGWPPLAAAALATLAVIARAVRPGRGAPWLPWAAALLIFLQPIGLDLSGSWLGWPDRPGWRGLWAPDPAVRATLESEVSPDDPGGAGEYLQRRLARDGPFRYLGYGWVRLPGEGGPTNYMTTRLEPGTHAILVNGRPMFLGLSESQGYNPLELGRYADFMRALNGQGQDYHTAYLLPSGAASPLLDLLGVRFVVIDSAIDPARADVAALRRGRREVFRTPLVSVWERDPAPGLAWIVHEARIASREEALSLLASGRVDGGAVALLETAPPPLGRPAAGAGESVAITRYEPDRIEIAAVNPAPGLLIVSEAWERGWRATVDGQEAPILPVHGWLRAIPLPAGEHTVEMRYDPLSLRLGMAITLAAALLLAGGSAWSLAGRRRP